MSRKLRQGEALDGARSAETVSVFEAGPKRNAKGDVSGRPFGRRPSQQFTAIEEDLKE